MAFSLASARPRGASRLRRTRLAYVDEPVALVPFLGARENVTLALALRGRPADRETRARRARLVGLEEHGERPVAEALRLVSGNEPRSRGPSPPGPRAIVADEPAARLDGVANALADRPAPSPRSRARRAPSSCAATHDPLLIEQADEVLALG